MVDAAVVNEVIDADGTVVDVVDVELVVDVVDGVVDVELVVDVVGGVVDVELVVDVVDVELVVDVVDVEAEGTAVVVVVELVVDVELVVPVGTTVVGTTVVAGGAFTPDETMVVGETVPPISTGTEITTVFVAEIWNTFQVRMTKPAAHFLVACTTTRDFVFTQTFKDPLEVGTVTFFVPEGHCDLFEMTNFFDAL
jgi:hypothetical protein